MLVDDRDLRVGMQDPKYHFAHDQCRANPPNSSFICTRKYGHDDFYHVASYSDGRICCSPWLNLTNLTVPEGL